MALRLILAVAVLAASAWSGWWYFGASAYRTGLETWINARANEGWIAEYDSLDVVGFPNRFDTKIASLSLGDESGAWRWDAPEFQMLSLSYAPQNVIAVWPGVQRLSGPNGTFLDLSGEPLRASFALKPLDQSVSKAILEADTPALNHSNGWSLFAQRLVFAVTEQNAIETGIPYRVGLEITDMRFPPETLANIHANGILPQQMQKLHVDGHLVFSEALTPDALRWDHAHLRQIKIRSASADWGELGLTATGDLMADSQGFAAGQIDLEMRNWRAILRASAATGTIDAALAQTLEAGLGLYAAFTGGNDQELNLPLVLRNGKMALGPIAIGPAPQFNSLLGIRP